MLMCYCVLLAYGGVSSRKRSFVQSVMIAFMSEELT